MANIKKGTLYLIPIPITEGGGLHTLSQEITDRTAVLTHYMVENVRTARRFLRSLHPKLPLEPLQFSEIDKHAGSDKSLFRKWLKEGHDVGVMSEAGCPGVADPGTDLVAIAQDMGVKVLPLVGPSSILLALMASGLSGQSFSFTGYLPVKDPMRMRRIKELEAISAKENQTQVFIETPYRNDYLLAELLKHGQHRTRLCIAMDITGPNGSIKTKTIGDWVKDKPVLGKVPVVFLLQGYQ